MEPDPRILKAFNAMRGLGISPQTVKPVLKNLLKLYNRKWELIEEDNYRTLVESIFECEDDKLKEHKRKEAMVSDGSKDSELPVKKLHIRLQDNHVSSTMDYGNPIVDLEDDQIRKTSTAPTSIGTSRPSAKGRIAPICHSLQPPRRTKGKEPVSSHMGLKDRKFGYETAFGAPYSDQPMNGKPKEKQHANELTHSIVPTKHLGSLRDISSADHSNNVKDDNYEKFYGNIFNITSSPSGEVKISSNPNPSHIQPVFDGPHIEAILKSVEKKFLRSHKIVASKVSVMDLLKELCESYLGLGKDSIERSVKKRFSEGSLSLKEPLSNSVSLVNAPQQSTMLDKKRAPHKISDLTNGAEKVKISLIDEMGNGRLPNFVYIPQNTIYQNAYVNFSLARIAEDDCCARCSGNCLSSLVPCACARDTGGEYAYTPHGLLKEEFMRAVISMDLEPEKHYHSYCEGVCDLERVKNPNKPELCKGHLLRKFIKECWRKCGCNMQCGNRVVQRGITCNLQVFWTKEGKGWGLRPLENLPKGAFVCEYVGEILTNNELYERIEQTKGQGRHTYPVWLDGDWGSERILDDKDALCLDATYYGNVARFINHRCHDGNLLAIPVEVESPDRHYYHLAFFTKEKVKALEEFTWDYGLDFEDDNHLVDAFECNCMSPFCRGMKRKG